jgi:hypothetical protein
VDKEVSKEKKELLDESTDFLERVFIIRRTALELAVQHAQYDPELGESFDRLHGTEIQLSALHNAGRKAALPARPTGWQCRYGCGNEPRR